MQQLSLAHTQAPVVWHLWVFLAFIVVILPEIVGGAFTEITLSIALKNSMNCVHFLLYPILYSILASSVCL